MCDCNADDFTARATQEGEVRRLRIEGNCTCPTTGFTLTLEPDNPGIVPQPEEVIVRLIESAPALGGDALTPTPVTYATEVGVEAARVVIRRADAEPLTVPITEAKPDDGYGGL